VIAKARLALEIVATYIRVRRAVEDRDVRNVLSRLRDAPLADAGAMPRDLLSPAARLSRATTRTLRWLPGDTRCLTQALVLSTLLARRAIPSRLVIGVTADADFGAHAWVELTDGRALLPPEEDRFARLVEL
jgi:hypothetical protein